LLLRHNIAELQVRLQQLLVAASDDIVEQVMSHIAMTQMDEICPMSHESDRADG